MGNNLDKTIEVLKKGGVVIFPTDTVFGIGCRIDNPIAVERIFKIKNREPNVPLPILVSTREMAEKYVERFNEEVIEKLIKKYWPGGLTIVTKVKKNMVLDIVRSNRDTVGVREPNDESLLKIIKEIGVPIIGTSANFHGEPSSTKFEQLSPNLIKKVDYVLDRNSKGELPSTIIDVTQNPWKIIREGAVKVNNLV